MKNTHIYNSAKNAFVATTLIAVLGMMSFFAFEPQIGHGQISSDFVVTQEITDEISWNVEAVDATMVGSITGLSGGFATSTTVVSVNTNSSTGYNMTLEFFDNAAAHAMVSSSTDAASDYISDYTPATPGTPDYDWVTNAGGGSAEFGYTVSASTSAEIASMFLDNGSACGSGSQTENKCWMSPSTTPGAETIIDSAAANGSSTTTLKFKVAVPNAPSPALPSGFYAATGTLTATVNP